MLPPYSGSGPLPQSQTAAQPPARARRANSCATEQQRAPLGSALPPNPTPHTRALQLANVPFPHAVRGDVLVVGSHVLQHLDHGEPALPSAAESPGGLGSPYLPVQHNPGSGGGGRGPLPSALQATTPPAGPARKQSPPLFPGELPAAWRAPQEADSDKMAAAPAEAGERRGTDSSNPRTVPDPRHRRQYCPLLVCKDPLFLPGPSGADEVPFRSRMEADEHEKWFREPPPPSLKSS